jgi:hypothetical protein
MTEHGYCYVPRNLAICVQTAEVLCADWFCPVLKNLLATSTYARTTFLYNKEIVTSSLCNRNV